MSTQFDTSAVVTSVHASAAAIAPSASLAPAAKSAAAAPTRTLSWIDKLTLAAIGVVVVLVTLPVLRGFGVRENERDALRMLRVLAAEPAANRGALVDDGQATLAELAAGDRVLHRRLEDLEALPDGRLRRHGYLFDVSALGGGEPMLRAWPWEHGQTGRAAYVWTPRRGILAHANRDGRYTGAGSPPMASEVLGAGWVAIPRR